MPELPEVETTRRGIEPHLIQQTVTAFHVRDSRLRWPVSDTLVQKVVSYTINSVERRAKYLLINFDHGQLMLHLGMSGRIRIIDQHEPAQKHDHIDMVLSSGKALRFTDPRRFGSCFWHDEPVAQKLLANLGPEPLSADFTGHYLYQQCKSRKAAIKQVIMDNKVVVGVGNIYAAESLFLAGLHPTRTANRISQPRINHLSETIQQVLSAAIKQGGTTLKDFTQSDGKPGYFAQKLMVYGREGELCRNCKSVIKGIRQGQRATAYCPRCQT